MTGRFYGKTTTFLRHVHTAQYVVEPQRAMHIPFWYCDPTATAPVDGADVATIGMREGSRIQNHRVELMITPETNDPQRFSMGVIKLSFHDIFSPFVCGSTLKLGSYQDATPTVSNATSYIRIWNDETTDKKAVYQTGQMNFTSLDTVRLDDNFKHFVRLKSGMVLNQAPLLSKRRMKIPAKVKRINPDTYYGLWFWNESPRGATPADTQLTVDVKQYFEEWAL